MAVGTNLREALCITVRQSPAAFSYNRLGGFRRHIVQGWAGTAGGEAAPFEHRRAAAERCRHVAGEHRPARWQTAAALWPARAPQQGLLAEPQRRLVLSHAP